MFFPLLRFASNKFFSKLDLSGRCNTDVDTALQRHIASRKLAFRILSSPARRCTCILGIACAAGRHNSFPADLRGHRSVLQYCGSRRDEVQPSKRLARQQARSQQHAPFCLPGLRGCGQVAGPCRGAMISALVLCLYMPLHCACTWSFAHLIACHSDTLTASLRRPSAGYFRDWTYSGQSCDVMTAPCRPSTS